MEFWEWNGVTTGMCPGQWMEAVLPDMLANFISVFCSGSAFRNEENSLGIVQLVKRLIVIPALSGDMNTRIARDKAIDEIHGNCAEMMVLEGKPSVEATLGQVGLEVQKDVADPFLHLLKLWEHGRDQPNLQRVAVDFKR